MVATRLKNIVTQFSFLFVLLMQVSRSANGGCYDEFLQDVLDRPQPIGTKVEVINATGEPRGDLSAHLWNFMRWNYSEPGSGSLNRVAKELRTQGIDIVRYDEYPGLKQNLERAYVFKEWDSDGYKTVLMLDQKSALSGELSQEAKRALTEYRQTANQKEKAQELALGQLKKTKRKLRFWSSNPKEQSEEWRRLQVRNPETQDWNDPDVQPLLKNAPAVIRQFESWFKSGKINGKSMNFEQMHIKQHILMIEGKGKSTSSYLGPKFGIENLKDYITPGEMTHKGIRAKDKFFLDTRHPSPNGDFWYKYADFVLTDRPPLHRIRVSGIPAEASPINRLLPPPHAGPSRLAYAHGYPFVKHRQLYVDRADALMSEMRSRFRTLSDEEFFVLLSDYYHTAVNAQFFAKVNNSILMNQVNVLLRMRGWKGVPHGRLDYDALANHFDDFRSVFMDWIARNQ